MGWNNLPRAEKAWACLKTKGGFKTLAKLRGEKRVRKKLVL